MQNDCEKELWRVNVCVVHVIREPKKVHVCVFLVRIGFKNTQTHLNLEKVSIKRIKFNKAAKKNWKKIYFANRLKHAFHILFLFLWWCRSQHKIFLQFFLNGVYFEPIIFTSLSFLFFHSCSRYSLLSKSVLQL